MFDALTPGGEGRVPANAPGGAVTFCARRQVTKEREPCCPRPPALRFGGNLRRDVCAVRRTHCAAAPLGSNNRGESDNEASAHLRSCHPANTPPHAWPKGLGLLNSPTSDTGHRCARPRVKPCCCLPVCCNQTARLFRLNRLKINMPRRHISAVQLHAQFVAHVHFWRGIFQLALHRRHQGA